LYTLRSQVAVLCVLLFLSVTGNTSTVSGAAPDLPLSTDQGKLKLSELRGQVIYLDFWASWCTPCRKSFPWMNQLQKKYASKGLRIVAVNVDSDIKLAREFLAENSVEFTIAFDPEGKVASAYDVRAMPSSYLIDRQGNIHSSHVGFREKDTGAMEAQIKKLLDQ